MNGIKTLQIGSEVGYEVIGFKNYYVTRSGHVYSTKVIGGHGKIDESKIRQVRYKVDKDGYFEVCFSENNKHTHLRVHRVVAKQFLPDWDDSLEVNHKDLNKQNNVVENLEMVTTQENRLHSWRTDTGILPSCQKDVILVDQKTNEEHKFTTYKDCSRKFPWISTSYIRTICNHADTMPTSNGLAICHIHYNQKLDQYEIYRNGTCYGTASTLSDLATLIGYKSFASDPGVHERFIRRVDNPITEKYMRYKLIFPSYKSIDYRKQLMQEQRKKYKSWYERSK